MGGNKQLLAQEASGMARAAYIRDYAHVRARNKYVRARALATIVFLQQNLRFIFLLHVCQIALSRMTRSFTILICSILNKSVLDISSERTFAANHVHSSTHTHAAAASTPVLCG